MYEAYLPNHLLGAPELVLPDDIERIDPFEVVQQLEQLNAINLASDPETESPALEQIGELMGWMEGVDSWEYGGPLTAWLLNSEDADVRGAAGSVVAGMVASGVCPTHEALKIAEALRQDKDPFTRILRGSIITVCKRRMIAELPDPTNQFAVGRVKNYFKDK